MGGKIIKNRETNLKFCENCYYFDNKRYYEHNDFGLAMHWTEEYILNSFFCNCRDADKISKNPVRKEKIKRSITVLNCDHDCAYFQNRNENEPKI